MTTITQKNLDQPQKPKEWNACKAYTTVVGGFLYMMVPGSVYCTGVFATYVKSYFRLPPDSNMTSNLQPATAAVTMFIMPLGSYLTQKGWRPKTLIAIGAAVMFPFFVLSTFVNAFWAFAMFYVLAFSWNQGICYMTPIHQGWAWFPGRGGLVSGIIIGGFGFGPLIFDNIITRTINPENLPVDLSTGYYDQSVDDRFLFTWRIVIASWFLLAVIGFFTIFEGPKKEKKLEPMSEVTAVEGADHDTDHDTDEIEDQEVPGVVNKSETKSSVFDDS